MRRRVPFVVMMVGLAAVAQSQDAPRVRTKECLTARPLPKCDALWIAEMEGAIPFSPRRWHDANVTWELGYMVNRPRGPALGASVFAQLGHGDFDGLGVRPRARWWFTDRTSLDVGPGIFLTSDDRRVGLSAMLALNTRLGALTATWIAVPANQGTRTVRSFFLGVRAGGWPGLIVGGATGALLGFLSLALSD